jgi:hypothetical protein
MNTTTPTITDYKVKENFTPQKIDSVQKPGQEPIDQIQTPTAVQTDALVSTAEQMAKINVSPEKPKEKFRIESFTSLEITPELVKEVADFYRWIFNHYRFLAYPKTFEFTPAAKVFGLEENNTVPMETMESSLNFPIHPKTGEKATLFHDPDTTYQKFSKIMEKNTYLSVLRDNENHNMVGMAFAYEESLAQIFTNEWSNECPYMKIQHNQNNNSFDAFIKILAKGFKEIGIDTNITPNTKMLCWHSTTTAPHVRGMKNMLNIIRGFFQLIPANKSNGKYLITESAQEGAADKIIPIGGGFTIPKVLEHNKIWCGDLSTMAKNFSLTPREFIALKKRRKK